MGKVTPILSGLKDLRITYKTPYESLQATPTSLPTTEPATSQIIYTVAEADLPNFNMTVESRIIVALMYAGGKNTDAAAQTVYWRMLRNGASVATGSGSISADYFWTLSSFFTNVAVGDVLEIRLWATATTVNWDYEARQLQFSRVALLEKYVLLLCNFIGLSAQPVLTLGTPSVVSTGSLFIDHPAAEVSTASAKDFSPWKQHPSYKLFRMHFGDYTSANTARLLSHSTSRPRYYRNWVPTRISLRALRSLT